MPTFCRHNRFLERCPICSKTLPDGSATTASPRTRDKRSQGAARGAHTQGTRRRGVRNETLRVQREGRAQDDGYRSPLAPGLRASADAERLAGEIAFSSGRLLTLAAQPPGSYGEARALAGHDLQGATWVCFLIAYLCPLEEPEPFAGIRTALRAMPDAAAEPQDPGDVPLGPRTSHDPARGAETLRAYRQWAAREGQVGAFTGDPGWTPQRRFERVFERLALPGLQRAARFDLLVTLGRLGLYPLTPPSLQLATGRGLSVEDLTTLAAKRVFGIADPLLLERRAGALAEAAAVPIETLDLALANWGAASRATLGCPADTREEGALERARGALGL